MRGAGGAELQFHAAAQLRPLDSAQGGVFPEVLLDAVHDGFQQLLQARGRREHRVGSQRDGRALFHEAAQQAQHIPRERRRFAAQFGQGLGRRRHSQDVGDEGIEVLEAFEALLQFGEDFGLVALALEQGDVEHYAAAEREHRRLVAQDEA
ncbi:MAG: hypothetical protein NTW87_15490, partial [Planctomycetota bacterium]|nr:hypothetical protein [Planctomycetota bacterium]